MLFEPLTETVNIEGVTFKVIELTGTQLTNLGRDPRLKSELAYGLEALRTCIRLEQDGKAEFVSSLSFQEYPKRVIDQLQQAYNLVNTGGKKQMRDAAIRAAIEHLPEDAPPEVLEYLNAQIHSTDADVTGPLAP